MSKKIAARRDFLCDRHAHECSWPCAEPVLLLAAKVRITLSFIFFVSSESPRDRLYLISRQFSVFVHHHCQTPLAIGVLREREKKKLTHCVWVEVLWTEMQMCTSHQNSSELSIQTQVGMIKKERFFFKSHLEIVGKYTDLLLSSSPIHKLHCFAKILTFAKKRELFVSFIFVWSMCVKILN